MYPSWFLILSLLLAWLPELRAGTPPEFLWAKAGGSTSDDYGNSIAVDQNGNSIVTGRFTGTASFLGTNMVSSGLDEIYLMKLDSNGSRVWLKRAGGTNTDEAYSTTLDSLGNIYVAGRFASTANFGTTNLTSAGTHDMFLAKYDLNGNFLWARRGGGTNVDYANAVCTDTVGNVFVAGIFSSSATFGNTVLTSGGGRDVFVAKYDAGGNLVWANSFGSPSDDVGFSIAADNSGSVFVSGWLIGAVTFAGKVANSLGAQDIFLAKYDYNGIAQWLRRAGGSAAYDYCYSVAVDTLGNPYVCGSFRSTATFGNTNLTSSGSADIALAKYDTAGNFLWAQKAGSSTGDDEAYGVAVDRVGNAFLTGYFRGTASFSGTNITSSGQHDLFIAKYASNGTFRWIQKGGGTNYDYGNSIALDSLGNAFVGGVFFSSASFGTNTATSAGGSDFLVTKLSTTTRPLISDVGDQSLEQDGMGVVIPFNVSDLETPASNLVVAATSSNTSLVPISRLVFGGSGTNRTVSISPATNQFGTTLITLAVTDSDGITNSDTFLLTVNPVNHAPVFTPLAIQVVNEETLLLVTNLATDVDSPSNTLTFSLVEAPSGASLASNGVFSWTPTEAQGPSTNLISVRVTDNGMPNLSSTNFFTVMVNEINKAPTISAASNAVIDVGKPFFMTNSAMDPDVPSNVVTYSLVTSPEGASITGQGGFSWTPIANQAATTNLVRVRVSDNGSPSLSSTNSFFIVVNPLGVEKIQLQKPSYVSGYTKLYFNAQAGQPYRIDYAPLTNAPWSELKSVAAPLVTTNVVVNDLVYDTNRIYRLVLAELPLRIDRATPNAQGLEIVFGVEGGRTYQVETRGSLATGAWVVATNFTAGLSTNRFSYFDSRKLTQQFYRLVLAEPPLRIDRIAQSAQGVQIFFATVGGRTYQVETRNSPTTGSWSVVTNFTAAVSTNSFSYFDSKQLSQQFYRLSIPARPSEFSKIEKLPAQFSFQFSGQAGINYTVEYLPSLTTNGWAILTNLTPVIATNVLIMDNSAAESQRLYRVRTN